jgi:large subunit ribosomal protein L9
MKVILKEDVDNLGNAGELVDVKPGYARNFLVPRGLALVYNAANQKVYEAEKKRIAQRQEKEKAKAQEMVARLEAVSVTIPAAVGDEDRMFGSVTSQDIVEHLKTQGIEVDKRRVLLAEPIKTLGLYEVDVKLHTDVIGKIKVWVVKKED